MLLINIIFALIQSKSSNKKIGLHFLKKLYKCRSPYNCKSSIFEKSFSDNYFNSETTFHNISYHLEIEKKISPIFKKFYKFWSPYGTKMSILIKVHLTTFFNTENMFHNVSHHLGTKRRNKNLVPIFQKFYRFWFHMGSKFRLLKKVSPTPFLTHKTCFTTFHLDLSQKTDKKIF